MTGTARANEKQSQPILLLSPPSSSLLHSSTRTTLKWKKLPSRGLVVRRAECSWSGSALFSLHCGAATKARSSSNCSLHAPCHIFTGQWCRLGWRRSSGLHVRLVLHLGVCECGVGVGVCERFIAFISHPFSPRSSNGSHPDLIPTTSCGSRGLQGGGG